VANAYSEPIINHERCCPKKINGKGFKDIDKVTSCWYRFSARKG